MRQLRYLRDTVSNGNASEQALIRRWWYETQASRGRIVWEYRLFNRWFADAVWFPDEPVVGEERAGLNHSVEYPLGGRDTDPGSAGQVFSEGDFAHGEYFKVPTYLGAPAGHVLRYDAGGTTCKGRSFITRHFKIVRGARGVSANSLPIVPGQRAPLYDQVGKPLPKPDYCKDE